MLSQEMYKEASKKPDHHEERSLKDLSQKLHFYLQKISYLLQGRRTDLDHLLMGTEVSVEFKVIQVKVGARRGALLHIVLVDRLPRFLRAGSDKYGWDGWDGSDGYGWDGSEGWDGLDGSSAISFSVRTETLLHESYFGPRIGVVVEVVFFGVHSFPLSVEWKRNHSATVWVSLVYLSSNYLYIYY